jgi:CARDB
MARPGKLLMALTLAALALLALGGGALAKGGKPDLAVTKLSPPPKNPRVGSKLALVVTVANEGAAPAGKSKLGVYLAKGRKPGKRDELLKAVKVKPLLPGRTAKLKVKLRLPGAAGRYRLVACADFKHQVKEAKEANDCRASRTIRLTKEVAPLPTAAAPPPPTAAAAPAFTATDDVDRATVERADGSYPEAGTPITATLRAANGIPGQAGYTRSEGPPTGFASGAATKLEFENSDDGQVTVSLPFAFPFGGIEERTASVGTNGWLGFGTSPANGYWGTQENDYRGAPTAVGEFYRGLMPFWADLILGSGGEVREVVPADHSFVAFQWEVQQFDGSTSRSFEVVLYPDGSFRFDYPGANETGIPSSFIGYSLGTGPASVEAVASNVSEVPSASLIFAPNPVAAPGPLPAGTATLTLPRGSALLEAPGCSLQQAPTALAAGSVSCPVSELTAGQQAERTVTYAVPPNAPGQIAPENFKFLGEYRAGDYELVDRDEVPLLYNYLESNTMSVGVNYASGTPTVGTEGEFLVHVAAAVGGGLDEPRLTLNLPQNATFDSLGIEGSAIPCGALSGGSITCSLPSGMATATVEVEVTPTSAGSPMQLEATAQALNTPPAFGSGSSPNVGA